MVQTSLSGLDPTQDASTIGHSSRDTTHHGLEPATVVLTGVTTERTTDATHTTSTTDTDATYPDSTFGTRLMTTLEGGIEMTETTADAKATLIGGSRGISSTAHDIQSTRAMPSNGVLTSSMATVDGITGSRLRGRSVDFSIKTTSATSDDTFLTSATSDDTSLTSSTSDDTSLTSATSDDTFLYAENTDTTQQSEADSVHFTTAQYRTSTSVSMKSNSMTSEITDRFSLQDATSLTTVSHEHATSEPTTDAITVTLSDVITDVTGLTTDSNEQATSEPTTDAITVTLNDVITDATGLTTDSNEQATSEQTTDAITVTLKDRTSDNSETTGPQLVTTQKAMTAGVSITHADGSTMSTDQHTSDDHHSTTTNRDSRTDRLSTMYVTDNDDATYTTDDVSNMMSSMVTDDITNDRTTNDVTDGITQTTASESSSYTLESCVLPE